MAHPLRLEFALARATGVDLTRSACILMLMGSLLAMAFASGAGTPGDGGAAPSELAAAAASDSPAGPVSPPHDGWVRDAGVTIVGRSQLVDAATPRRRQSSASRPHQPVLPTVKSCALGPTAKSGFPCCASVLFGLVALAALARRPASARRETVEPRSLRR
jgi:hypothetical protein